MKKKLIHRIGPLIALAIFGVALLVLRGELAQFRYRDILDGLKELPVSRILGAFILSALNYWILTGYDRLALRYIGHPLPYPRVVFASFIGYALGANIGFSTVPGALVRYRLYSVWGLSAEEIAKVVAFCALTLWLGLFSLSGLVFSIDPISVPKLFRLPFSSVQPFGFLFLALLAAYLLLIAFRKKPLRIRSWKISLPSVRLSVAQILVSCLDWILAAGVLYILISGKAELSFISFLPLYLLAKSAGSVSQIPGGLGVFETAVLILLAPAVSFRLIIGSLLVYRAIHFLLPLIVAIIAFGIHQYLGRRVDHQAIKESRA